MANSDISIVIPVYNEEDRLAGCLDSITSQSLLPGEVIIVNNNSTDKTIEIAKRYSFVKVINEDKQGVIYARHKGFSACSGDILVSTDADARVSKDWLENISKLFKDKSTDGFTGGIKYYDVFFPWLFNYSDKLTRGIVDKQLAGRVLQGANMAIRRSAFNKVKDQLCMSLDVQDDSDLALHLYERGAKLIFDPSIIVYASVYRVKHGFVDIYRYYHHLPYTYKKHGEKKMFAPYLAFFIILAFYPLLLIVHIIYLRKHQSIQ